jgi:DNA-directed DNA polymerase III PolC
MNSVLPACHSSFSLLYGTASIDDLVEAAVAYGYKSLLLADRGNLYGCYDFYFAAREQNIKPIIGVEIPAVMGNLLLICENHDGFKNLSRVVTHYQLQREIPPAALRQNRDGVICLADCRSQLDALKEIYADSLYLQIDYHQPSKAARTAHEKRIPAVVCPPVSFLSSDDYRRHRLLRAIEGHYLLDNLPDSQTAHKEAFLKSPETYRKIFSEFSDALKNSRRIGERCDLVFPHRKNILPDIKIDGAHFEKLKNDSLNGLRQKLSRVTGRYLSRLEYELSVIQRTGFVDYLLIVGEIVNFCRMENIAVVGRGSAAGSLVSYGLGITQVDPIREKLYFERFLNEARSDCPDIDLDIDWRRRDDVLDHVYKKYGGEHVAMIASYIRFQPRLAVRECAKAMGFAPEEIDKFTKNLSSHPLERNDFGLAISSGTNSDRERFMPVLKAARSISKLPRHLGIHPGGIVITPESLTNYVPLERATKGLVVTQCDMYQAEKIGLVKIDILGQRGLAVITDCYSAVREIKGNDFNVPDDDAGTYSTLQKGKTIGVFQIESPGLRALLKDLKPCRLNDITLALSLIRPGASESGMKKVFLDRFHKKEKTIYPHQKLEDVLDETHGVFIYQEQVILAAQKVAGFNLPASDLMRRAITKKRKEGDQTELKKRFLEGARRTRVDARTAEDIFSQLAQFASFGFCKAHAATYGHLAYQSAYFKTHYPEIFMTAVLRNGGGYYPAAVYVAEARRLGIKVMPPDINLSESIDTLRNGRIYLGIDRVKDISLRTAEQIERGRPFVSLENFLSKINLSERETENLIRVGFFDSLEISRPKLLWQYRLAGGRNSAKNKDDLFGGDVTVSPITRMPELTPFSRYEIFKAEKDILELSASFHPLSMFPEPAGEDPDTIFGMKNGRPVVVSGWLADRKRIKTRDGQSMVFLTFDSINDTFEVVLFPDVYNRYREVIRKYRYLMVEGNVNIDDGNTGIIARKISPAPTGLKDARRI